MTVFVDAPIHVWRGMKWCHLLCADLGELHAFAKSLGLSKTSFQAPPRASRPHYDLTENKRLIALKLGAQAADRRMTMLVSSQAMVAWCREHRPAALPVAEAMLKRWSVAGAGQERVLESGCPDPSD